MIILAQHKKNILLGPDAANISLLEQTKKQSYARQHGAIPADSSYNSRTNSRAQGGHYGSSYPGAPNYRSQSEPRGNRYQSVYPRGHVVEDLRVYFSRQKNLCKGMENDRKIYIFTTHEKT